MRRRLPLLLTLQNGVGNDEALAAAFGAERIVTGAIDTPVSVPAPGQVQRTSPDVQDRSGAGGRGFPGRHDRR